MPHLCSVLLIEPMICGVLFPNWLVWSAVKSRPELAEPVNILLGLFRRFVPQSRRPAKNGQRHRNRSRRHRLLGSLGQFGKGFGFFHSQIGQNLAIEIDCPTSSSHESGGYRKCHSASRRRRFAQSTNGESRACEHDGRASSTSALSERILLRTDAVCSWCLGIPRPASKSSYGDPAGLFLSLL